MVKRALLGIHDPTMRESYMDSFELENYQIEIALTREELTKKLSQAPYQRYLLDANFGKPGSIDISPARDAWEHARANVEKGLAKFMAISGDKEVIAEAKKEGIPAIIKTEFAIMNFLED